MRFCLVSLVLLSICAVGCSSQQAPSGASDADTELNVETPQLDESADTSDSEPDTKPDESVNASDSNLLSLDLVTFAIPEGWDQKQVSSDFLLAEFGLPAEDGGEAGRLTVSVAGGSVQANIDRWKGQFGGKPEHEAMTNFEANELPVTMVDLFGEFDDRRGPFGPSTKKADFRMLAAIIAVGDQLHFVKATGPKSTLAIHEDRINEFVHSVKRK